MERTRFLDDPGLFPRTALEAVRELVPCPVASFNEVDPAADRIVAIFDPPDYTVPDHYLEAFGQLAGEHPLIRHLNETGDGSAVKISDFLTRVEYRASPIYGAVYGPIGVEYQMSITLPAPLPRIVAIACSRSDRDFDERERALMNALRPHLAQSYQFVEERARLASAVGALESALREDGRLVLALDGGPHELTPGAAELLGRYAGDPDGGPLPERVQRWLDTQTASTGRGPGARPRLLTPLSVHRGATTLVLRYLPGTNGAGAIVLNERPRELATAELRLLGLTQREAEILQQLAKGASDREITGSLHIAPGTVRKHLDNLYRKLGVSSRGRAVASAVALLSGAVHTGNDPAMT